MKFINEFLENIKKFVLRFTAPIFSIGIQEFSYGHFLSSLTRSSVDKNNHPLPWFSYPAIEFLKQFDFSQSLIFEYGSGNSTIFWSKLTKKVVSIENNPHWYKKITNLQIKNVEIKLKRRKNDYVNSLKKLSCEFDIIVIDGSYRTECARLAPGKLKRGGIIILDNSDWCIEAAKILKDSGLIQVDMIGLAPINFYTTATSFFLDRHFNMPSKCKNQPEGIIGSLKQVLH